MKIKYEDGPDVVDVPAADRRVKRGEAVEIEDEAVASALLEQGWVKAGGSFKPRDNDKDEE